MIYTNDITQWGVNHPWATRDDIEQDLLLSQAICEIANDPLLGKELVLRGGTAFHKLFLPKRCAVFPRMSDCAALLPVNAVFSAETGRVALF